MFVLIDRYDEFGRQRSNSLNATVENLILSKKSPIMSRFCNKPRGSVPTLTNIPRKMLIQRQHEEDSSQQRHTSLPGSPTSTNDRKWRHKMSSPLKFMRNKYNDQAGMQQECCSPKSKRAFDPNTAQSLAGIDLECMSFRPIQDGSSIEQKIDPDIVDIKET